MASGNQIKFGVGYQIDKASVQKVKQSLRQLQQVKLGDFSGSVKEFVKMQEMAEQVRVALNKAFNVNLNSLNTEKFNQQLGLSANKINEIYTLFSKAGATGQRAFSSLTSSILTTNLKLRQTQSLISSMGQTMANTIKWGIASSVMNTFTNSVRQAFEYVKNLDSALTDIRIVTGDSTQRMKEFSVQANQAAQSLGRSTMDYTKAALTFYQQGLSDEDVQARTQSVLVAQNITGAGQEMADYLTAVWNGYKVANEEAELYVDKLAAVADSSASNMSQLAIAMSKVASTANMLGVPVDNLNAQIATIVATTRQAPESVGNALKTIYARINDIATGADDAQISLGNYSEKMAEVGISVLDANGRLRDTGDVIDEVGQKWATLSREQQIYLARTMAGQRQYNNLLALFENWGRYTDLVNISMDAQGAAMEKNERYMDSLAAKMEQFGAAGERVKSALVNQNDLKGITDFGTKAVNLFANIIESIGGGGNAMLAFGSIVTSVFSNTIAKEINGFITNLQNIKYNAEQTTKQFELMKVVAQSEGANEAGTKALMGQLQAARAYYKFMTPAQQNEYNATAAKIAQLETQTDVYKKLHTQATLMEQAYNQQSKFSTFEDFSKNIQQNILKPLQGIKPKAKNAVQDLSNIFLELRNNLGTKIFDFEGSKQLYQIWGKIRSQTKLTEEEIQRFKILLKSIGNEAFIGSQNIQQIDQLARKFHLSKDQAELLTQQLKHTREELKQFSTIKTFVNMASAIGGIASAINSVVNITKIWKNENLSTGEKLLQTFTNLGMVVGMLTANIGKLREGFSLLTAKIWLANDAQAAHIITTKGMEAAEKAATIQTATLSGAFKALWTTLKANPIILILSGIAAAVTAGIALYDKFHMSAEEAAQAIDKFNQKQKESLDNIKNYSEGKASLEQVKEEYEKLAQKAGAISFDSNIDELTEKERERYNQIKSLVAQYNEDAIIGYNKQGQAILDINQSLQDQIKILQKKRQAEIDATYSGPIYQQAEKARKSNYERTVQEVKDEKAIQEQLINSGLLNLNNSIGVNSSDTIFYNALKDIIDNTDEKLLSWLDNYDFKSATTYADKFKQYINQILLGEINISDINFDILKEIFPEDLNDNVKAGYSEVFNFINSLETLLGDYQNSLFKIQSLEQQSNNLAKFDFTAVLSKLQLSDYTEQYKELSDVFGQSFIMTAAKNYTDMLDRTSQFETETDVAEQIKNHLFAPLLSVFSEKSFSELQNQISEGFEALGNIDSYTYNEYYSIIRDFINNVISENEDLQLLAQENSEAFKSIIKTLFNIDIGSYDINNGRIYSFNSNDLQALKDMKTDAYNAAEKWVNDNFQDVPQEIQEKIKTQLQYIVNNAKAEDLQLFLSPDFFGNLNISSSVRFGEEDIAFKIQDLWYNSQNALNPMAAGYGLDFITELPKLFAQTINSIKKSDQALSQLNLLGLLGNKDNLKDDQLVELQEGLNKLIQTYPELTGAVQILNNKWLEGTSMYQRALHDVTTQIFETAQTSINSGIMQQEQVSAYILSFVKDIETLQDAQNKHLLTSEDYSQALIKMASSYENCAQQLEKYLLALNSGTPQTLANAESTLALAIRIGELSEQTGISADQIEKMSDVLQNQIPALAQNNQLAADAAVRYIKLNTAISDIYDSLEDYKNLIIQINENGIDAIYANQDLYNSFNTLKESIADIFDTSSELLGDDWIVNNIDKIFNMIETGGEGLQELQQLAAQEILLNIGIDTSEFTTEANLAQEDFLNAIAQMEQGADISLNLDLLSWTQQLVTAMEQAGYAQEDIEKALSGIGIDVDLAPYEEGLNQAIDDAMEAGILASDHFAQNAGVDVKTNTQTTVADNNLQIPEVEYDIDYATANAGTLPVMDFTGSKFGLPTGIRQVPMRMAYPVYRPKSRSATSTGQVETAATALEVVGAHKSSGGKVSHYNSPTSRANRASKGKSSGGGGGSKGGGGGSAKQPTMAKISTDTISTKAKQTPYNPYEEVEKSYERQEDLLKDLDELEKHLQGEDRLNNIQKQNKELIKQNSIIEERQKISEDAAEQGSTAWYRNQLLADEALRDIVRFDPDGQVNETVSKQAITDAFNKELAEQKAYYEAAQNSYNNWIENVWNKYSGEQQQANKKQKEQYDEDLKNAKKNAQDKIKIAEEEYNDRTKLLENYQKALEEDNKFYEQYLDNIEKLIENRIAESKIKVDLAFDFGQTERQWEEFENKFIKRLQKDDIFANAKASFRELQSYFNSSEITQAQKEIDKVRKEIALIQSGQYSSIYGITQQEFNNLTESDRNNLQKRFLDQATKDLQDYQKKLMDSLEEVQDKQEEIQELYLDSIDKAKDKMDDVISQYERINDLVEHNIKLTELLYGDNAGFDIRNSYYNRQSVNNSRMLEALRQQQAYWQSQLDNATPDTEDWRRFKENLENVTDAINSALENQLDLLATKFENKIQGALANIQNKLTNGLGNTFLDNQWEFINDDDEAFLDAVNSKFGIDEVEQLYEDAAAGAEGNIVQQQRINKLMNDQLKALREKDKLTQYDIDRAKAALEVEKARMALEDARNNKTRMRLRRDSQGNYTYQYVADEEKLSDLQSALADAESQLYNMDKEHYKQQLNEMYDTYKDYLERRADLEREMQATQDANERARIQARIKLLEETYTEYADNITGDLQYTLSNYLTESAAAGLGVDLSQYSTAEQIEFLKDNLPYINTEIQNLADTITGEDGILNSTRQYLDELTAAFTEYNQEVQDALSLAGTSVLSIASTIDDQAIAQTEQWLGLYEEAALETQNIIENMQKLLEEMQKFMNEDFSSSDVIQSLYNAEQMLEKILNPDQIDENTILTGTSATIGYGTLGPDQDINALTDEQRQMLQSLQDDYLTQQADFNMLADELALSDINSYTENILANADEILDNIYNTYKDDLRNRLEHLLLQEVNSLADIMNSVGDLNNSQTLDQNVTIEASFPNVTSHTEIEQALNNLVNMASQQAARQRP